MTLDRLRCFCSVANHLNFTRAAEECHIAQTAVSRHIAELEKNLGTTLFLRNSHSVELTAAGEIFYQGIESVLAQYDHTVRKVQELSAQQSLCIGMGLFERSFVSKLVAEFHELYPRIDISIVQCPYTELIQGLLSGKMDIVFAIGACAGYIDDERIETFDLFEKDAYVFVSKNADLATRSVIQTADLEGRTMLTVSEQEGPFSLNAYMQCVKDYDWKPKRVIQVNSLAAELLMIEAGMGIAVGPQCIVDELPAGVKAIPLDKNLYSREVVVALKRKGNQNVAAQHLLNGIETSRALWEWIGQLENLENRGI